MNLALRELRRRPGRFVAATGMLTVIVVLLLLLAGLLDGLFLGSTGALRAQPGDAVVYSATARSSLLRSRIDPELRRRVEAAPGVRRTGGLGVALVGARVPGRDGTTATAVFGYELAPRGVPAPPPPGSAWADRRLAAGGVEVGQTLALGPTGVPVRVAGWVEDTAYLLQGALWVDPATWREVRGASRPDAAVADGVFQVLVVDGAGAGDGDGAGALARAVDGATGGDTRTLTRDEAVLSLPGTRQQQATFTAILGVTFVVAGLVVALFFALLVLERTALYGVLKALGAPAWRLAAALTVQAVVVAVVAFAAGGGLALAIAAVLPAEVPLQLVPSRAAGVAAGVVVTAALGGALPLRRITRIDPAVAISGA